MGLLERGRNDKKQPIFHLSATSSPDNSKQLQATQSNVKQPFQVKPRRFLPIGCAVSVRALLPASPASNILLGLAFTYLHFLPLSTYITFTHVLCHACPSKRNKRRWSPSGRSHPIGGASLLALSLQLARGGDEQTFFLHSFLEAAMGQFGAAGGSLLPHSPVPRWWDGCKVALRSRSAPPIPVERLENRYSVIKVFFFSPVPHLKRVYLAVNRLCLLLNSSPRLDDKPPVLAQQILARQAKERKSE